MSKIGIFLCWLAVALIASSIVTHALDERVPVWVQTAGVWSAYAGFGIAIGLIVMCLVGWWFVRPPDHPEEDDQFPTGIGS